MSVCVCEIIDDYFGVIYLVISLLNFFWSVLNIFFFIAVCSRLSGWNYIHVQQPMVILTTFYSAGIATQIYDNLSYATLHFINFMCDENIHVL